MFDPSVLVKNPGASLRAHLYTDCCLDQGTHQNTVIEVGGFRFDLAIPSPGRAVAIDRAAAPIPVADNLNGTGSRLAFGAAGRSGLCLKGFLLLEGVEDRPATVLWNVEARPPP